MFSCGLVLMHSVCLQGGWNVSGNLPSVCLAVLVELCLQMLIGVHGWWVETCPLYVWLECWGSALKCSAWLVGALCVFGCKVELCPQC